MSKQEAISKLKSIILKQAKKDAKFIWEDYFDIKEELINIGYDKIELLEYISGEPEITSLEDNNMDASLENESMNSSEKSISYKELYYEIDGYEYYFEYFRDTIIQLMKKEKIE